MFGKMIFESNVINYKFHRLKILFCFVFRHRRDRPCHHHSGGPAQLSKQFEQREQQQPEEQVGLFRFTKDSVVCINDCVSVCYCVAHEKFYNFERTGLLAKSHTIYHAA
jgi:hypothetical protein